jgi:uncharacterized protein (DUF1501 family)
MATTHHSCPSLQHARLGRRSLLTAGAAGLLGLQLPGARGAVSTGVALPVRAKRVIFLFQWGGPSHLDTFDLKPSAPAEIRGPLAAIPSVVPGLPVSEHFPEMAKRMDRVTLIHSMTHTMKNHNSAGYYALTGHAPPSDDQRLRDSLDLWPAYGSVVDKLRPNQGEMPTFVSYPHTIADGSITPGQHASFLGKRHDPFFFSEDPAEKGFHLPQLALPADLELDRMQRRRELLRMVDQQAGLLEQSAEVGGFDASYDKAIGMLTSPAVKAAFDLESEPQEVRDRYGPTSYGQSCLLARRLVEAGVTFTTVYFSRSIGGQKIDTGGWDTHGFNNTRMYEIVDKYHHPLTDQTLSVLLDDLEERGLIDDTLVLWVGEFGRTPKINDSASRDHWPQCYTALLAGGGVKRGYVHGASDAQGMFPAKHPVRPEDLAATLYMLMGIDPTTEVHDLTGRPLSIAGKPVTDVIA